MAGFAQADLVQVTPARIAIVIGNSDYASIVDLPNAARDASDMGALLTDLGYTVYAAQDLDRLAFEELLRRVMLNVPDGSDVVFFYAGHGIQIGARNYLLPTDVNFTDVHDLPLYSITLDRVIDALSARGSVHVAIIDACRENPFPDLRIAADVDAALFETRSGFEPFRTPLNSLIAFSTSPGATAQDGEAGENSPYTAAILASVRAGPRESALTLLGQVREQVYNATGGAQVPWESSTLIAPFHFVDESAIVPAQDNADTDSGVSAAQDATERGAVADLPEVAIDATLMLDRFVRLDTQMTDRLGATLENPVIVTAPRFGEVAIAPDNGGIFFRPALQEVRAADRPDYSLTDLIRIETGPPEARQSVALDLTLVPDACDMQAGDALDLDGVGLFRYPNEIDITAALAACQAAVAARPDVARFQYQLGRAQRAAGDFEAALGSFENAVTAGHMRANNALAALLTTQRIDRAVFAVPFDPDRATVLLDAAIEAGDPYAMQTRGVPLLRDGDTEDDRRRGYELIDRAAELGHTYAMNALGFWFLNDDSDHFIPARGVSYLTASAQREDIYGYHGLGYAALNGFDMAEPDYAQAYDWYERAALGGHPASPLALGRMEMRGQVGEPDPAAALGWFDMGLARGDGTAGISGAETVLTGAVPGLGSADAAIRAAKTALLPAETPAQDARELLARLDAQTLGLALQSLLAELGEPITADGAVGPATLAALARLQDTAGLGTEIPTDPVERLVAAARVHWARYPVRPDVF